VRLVLGNGRALVEIMAVVEIVVVEVKTSTVSVGVLVKGPSHGFE
jgi:hypothetical protein